MILWILKQEEILKIDYPELWYKFDPMDFETFESTDLAPSSFEYKFDPMDFETSFTCRGRKRMESINLILWILKLRISPSNS